MRRTTIVTVTLLLLAALSACDDPVASIGAGMHSWCHSQPNCDADDKR